MANTICWFEIYVQDIQRAKQFYSTVLQTSFKDITPPGDADSGMQMSFFDGGNNDAMHDVSGALVHMPGACPDGPTKGMSTMVYFPCDDCAVEASRVASAGGTVFQNKMDIGDHGFCVICIDTEGNFFGLHSLN